MVVKGVTGVFGAWLASRIHPLLLDSNGNDVGRAKSPD